MTAKTHHPLQIGWWILGLACFGLGGYWYVTWNVQLANQGRHNNDFKHLYVGAQMVRFGKSPYDRQAAQEARELLGVSGINPYVYLPFTAQVMMPLTSVPLRQASGTWFEINHALTWIGYLALAVALGWVPWKRRTPDEDKEAISSNTTQHWGSQELAGLGAAFLAVFASFALFRTLTAGQLNMVLFGGIAVVYLLINKQYWATAGVVASFLALFKIIPGILFIYFILIKQWRAVIGMIAGGLIFLLFSMIHIGFGAYLEFLPLAAAMGYGKSTWGDAFTFYRDPSNQSINSFFHHVFVDHADSNITPWFNLGAAFADNLTLTITLFMLGITFYTIYQCTKGTKNNESAYRFSFGAIVMMAILTPSLMWDHYTTIAMISWMLLIPNRESQITLPRLTALLLLAVALGWPVNYWHVAYRSGPELMLMSARLWPSLILWGWCIVELWRLEAPGESVEVAAS
jgi:hypothetical protein